MRAGQAPDFVVASNEVLRSCGLQANLEGPKFLPRLRLIINTEPEYDLIEGGPETLYDLTHPQGDRSPAFQAPHATCLLLRVLNLRSQAELLATELSAVNHIQVRIPFGGAGGGGVCFCLLMNSLYSFLQS